MTGKLTEFAMKHFWWASLWIDFARSGSLFFEIFTVGRRVTCMNRPPPSDSMIILPSTASR